MTGNEAAPIRIGILGAARIAPLALVNPANENVEVVVAAVAARDASRARRYLQSAAERLARQGDYHPFGLQMNKVVEGQLSCWGVCEQDQWWGLVIYPIAYGSKRKAVTHWIPAWLSRKA